MSDSLDPIVTEALRSWRIQLESGIPSNEALDLCAGLLRGSERACFLQASERTSKGQGINAVLEALAPVLSPAERAILAAGWSSGRVEATLDSLVRQRELWRDARRRILGKAVMPIGTLIAASFIAPILTLIGEDGSVILYLIYVTIPLGLAAALCIAAVLFFRARALAPVFNADGTPVRASGIDRLMLGLPLISHIERQRSLAEFGDLLSNLLGAGALIGPALETTAHAVRNGCYREECLRLSNLTTRGNPLGPALLEEPTGIWPHEFCAAVAVGEQSGALDATLARLAQNARERYIRAIETFAEWLPRFIYGLVAMFVIWNIFKFALSYMKMINDAMPPGA